MRTGRSLWSARVFRRFPFEPVLRFERPCLLPNQERRNTRALQTLRDFRALQLSLRALVDPGADQPDLLFGQRRDFVFVVRRRHVVIFIGAGAGLDNFAVLTAF